MEKFIECGERTVQKLGRISIADVMAKHDIEPGDVVIVDIRVPYSSDDIAYDECSMKLHALETMYSWDMVIETIKTFIATNPSTRETSRDGLVAGQSLKNMVELCTARKSLTAHEFNISDSDYDEYIKSEYGDDTDLGED